MTREQWLKDLFGLLSTDNPMDFMGVGLIFYRAPTSLPVVPLVPGKLSFQLPITIDESIRLVKDISCASSPFHDGFHLVDEGSLLVTHVSQFFAPPTSAVCSVEFPSSPVGARHMAALLGSVLDSISATAILSRTGCGVIFEQGSAREIGK